MRTRSSLLLLATGCGTAPPVIEVIAEPDTILVEVTSDCCCDDTGGGGTTTEPPGACDDFEAPSTVEVGVDATCATDPVPVEVTFAPEVEWAWAPSATDRRYNQVMVAPIVGNLTDDNGDGVIDANDTPDVAFTAFEGGRYDAEGALVIVDGATGAEVLYAPTVTLADGSTDRFAARAGVAAADVDADGTPEVCAPTQAHRVVCLHADGTVALEGDVDTTLDIWVIRGGHPTIGDLDGDGLGEVAIGNVVWNHDGSIRFQGGSAHGMGSVRTATGTKFGGATVFSDLDGNGLLEVVAGNTVYREDGSILWKDATADDGPSAVADLDLDGFPEVFTTGAGVGWIFDAGGALVDSFDLVDCDSGAVCGPPTVADFDGDGEPELGIGAIGSFTVYDNAGSGWEPLWTADTEEGSGATAASVFDFEDDGFAEVVYADEDAIRVLDGLDGTDALGAAGFVPTDHASATGLELPALADCDNDGSTEILLASNTVWDPSGWHGVRAIGSGAGDAWAPSRPVWNQHGYHIDHIDDDLGIPVAPTSGWTTHNTFRAASEPGIPDIPGDDLPDLVVLEYSSICVDCDAGEAHLYVLVANQGLADADPSTLALQADGVTLTTDAVPELPAGTSTVMGPYTLDIADWSGPLSAVVDPDGTIDECDEDNNDSASMGIVWEHHCE